MSKKIIWILIGIMAVAVMALILLQIYWVRNAVYLKEQEFGHLVNKTLAKIVKQIEEQETVLQISNEIVSFNNDTAMSQDDKQFFKEISERLNDSLKVNVTFDGKNVGNAKHNKTGKNVLTKDSIVYKRKKTSDNSSYDEFDSKKISIKQDSKSYFKDKAIFVENVVNKLIRVNMDLRDRIQKPVLEAIIAREFKNNGIKYRYEYAVQKGSDELIYNSAKFTVLSSDEKFRTALFPDDFFSVPYFLIIYFPNEEKSIYGTIRLMVISSIIMTLIITLTFGFTLLIIFRQKKLSELKNDFINNMTHELKTPISTISLALQMLKDKSIPAEFKNVDRISDIIDDESKRLGQQVEKVLQMAIYEKGNINLKKREIDCHRIIQNVIKNFELQVQAKDGNIDCLLIAEKPVIYADEVHFTGVISNLIDNAVKYSNENPKINISTMSDVNGLTISVKDNGIGISKENVKKIFENFYRVPTGNMHNVKGFGIGLSYVKKMVEAHGGSIKVKSEPKLGSEFIITIPFNHSVGK